MKTIEQVRDELAAMVGGDADFTTLDGIAAMMPEGWVTQIHIATGLNGGKSLCQAVAFEVKPSPKQIGGDKGITTELEARTRLLHAVLTATKGATHE